MSRFINRHTHALTKLTSLAVIFTQRNATPPRNVPCRGRAACQRTSHVNANSIAAQHGTLSGNLSPSATSTRYVRLKSTIKIFLLYLGWILISSTNPCDLLFHFPKLSLPCNVRACQPPLLTLTFLNRSVSNIRLIVVVFFPRRCRQPGVDPTVKAWSFTGQNPQHFSAFFFKLTRSRFFSRPFGDLPTTSHHYLVGYIPRYICAPCLWGSSSITQCSCSELPRFLYHFE